MYNRQKVVEYAATWAFSRNPRYYNFDKLGGDCTSFISQCLYAGTGVMNYTPVTGWFYISANNRSAAWTGVPYLHKFLTTNRGPGPYGSELDLYNAEPGDVIQLSFDGARWAHSLLVTATSPNAPSPHILISTHTYDSFNRPLSSYTYKRVRLIHIEGGRR